MIAKKKDIIVYGIAFALLLGFLKAIEYRYLIKSFSIDLYLGAIALVFTTLGIWVAYKILPITSANNPHSVEIRAGDLAQNTLSPREIEVLTKMANGRSNQEIAESLHISVHTVKTHSSKIFEKLDVKRRTQAVWKAKQLGILEELRDQ